MSELPLVEHAMTEVHANLMARFGLVMSTEEVAATLKMSVPALRMAQSRKVLTIQPLAIKGRRGQLYDTADVAGVLTSWLAMRVEEPPM